MQIHSEWNMQAAYALTTMNFYMHLPFGGIVGDGETQVVYTDHCQRSDCNSAEINDSFTHQSLQLIQGIHY